MRIQRTNTWSSPSASRVANSRSSSETTIDCALESEPEWSRGRYVAIIEPPNMDDANVLLAFESTLPAGPRDVTLELMLLRPITLPIRLGRPVAFGRPAPSSYVCAAAPPSSTRACSACIHSCITTSFGAISTSSFTLGASIENACLPECRSTLVSMPIGTSPFGVVSSGLA